MKDFYYDVLYNSFFAGVSESCVIQRKKNENFFGKFFGSFRNFVERKSSRMK